MSQSLVVLQRGHVVTIFMFVDTFRLVPDGLIVVFLIFQRSSLRFSVRMLLFCLSVAIVTDHTLRLAICSGIRHSSGQDSFSVFPFSLVGIRLSTYGIQLFSYIQLSVCLSLTYPESMELPSTVQRCLLYVSLAFRSVIFCIGISPLHLLASILVRKKGVASAIRFMQIRIIESFPRHFCTQNPTTVFAGLFPLPKEAKKSSFSFRLPCFQRVPGSLLVTKRPRSCFRWGVRYYCLYLSWV